MIRVIQGTISPGFGGLELVIIEFHQWLMKNNIESYVLAIEGTPLESHLLQKGFRQSTISISKKHPEEMKMWRKKLDGPEVAFLFHRHQGLKQLSFSNYKAKVSAFSHTFYDVTKRDLWHRYIFSKVDNWVALTASHKANLIQTTGIDPKKVCIIPNGVDLNKFTAHFKKIPDLSTAFRIGVIARLDRQKGQEVAIQALKILSLQGIRKWTLCLYGQDTPSEAPSAPILKKLAEDLGVGQNVEFMGFQDNLGPKINDLDLIWMPSYKETFGRCIIEGMAAGIPVIASSAGGVPDIIQSGYNGVLFQTKNAMDLANKTIALIENPEVFSSIQKQARKDVEEKYNVEEIWPRLLECISPIDTNS